MNQRFLPSSGSGGGGTGGLGGLPPFSASKAMVLRGSSTSLGASWPLAPAALRSAVGGGDAKSGFFLTAPRGETADASWYATAGVSLALLRRRTAREQRKSRTTRDATDAAAAVVPAAAGSEDDAFFDDVGRGVGTDVGKRVGRSVGVRVGTLLGEGVGECL